MQTVNFLAQLVENHQILVYALIFLGIIIEGEFILLCTGILVHLGGLNIYFALPFVFVGGILKSFLGYSVGRFIYDKWNHVKFFKYIEKRVRNTMPHFRQRPFWSIFISKFIMVNHIVIIFAGYHKVQFKKYFKAEFLSTLIWAPGLITLGYFFSYTAISISHEIWRFLMIVLVLSILFVLLDKLISWLYEMFEEFYHDHKSINE